MSLEGVFTSGDIAKQMPFEAKKFVKIDKDFSKVMSKARETLSVVQSCKNCLFRSLSFFFLFFLFSLSFLQSLSLSLSLLFF